MNKCLNCNKETNNKKFCSISCQNKFQNVDKLNGKFGLFKDFKVKCEKCGHEFVVNEREKLFPQKEKYYCSRTCANSRMWSDDDKLNKRNKNKGKKLTQEHIDKISGKNNGNYKHGKCCKGFVKEKTKRAINKSLKTIILICKECNESFIVPYAKRKRQFCSIHCSSVYKGKIGGKKSVSSQAFCKRSKNEIYFAELCEKYFNDVLTNKALFNGWDADAIIQDVKAAVLWNGKWHYEKITKNHSVEQVQNRDCIKIKEIIKSGYIPYVIKDMGKYNRAFVEKEFEKFYKYFVGE